MTNAETYLAVCAVTGATVVTNIEAFSSGIPVTDFPPADEEETYCEVVSLDPSQWFALSESLEPPCDGTSLDLHDVGTGPTTRCLASSVPGVPDGSMIALGVLTATAGGGAAYMVWTSGGAYLMAVDSNAHPLAEFLLEGICAADATSIVDAELIGQQLIVDVEPLNEPELILAYALPGVGAAAHGWVSFEGGPMHQNSPQ